MSTTQSGKYCIAPHEAHPSITIAPSGTVIDYGRRQETILPSDIHAIVVDSDGNERLINIVELLKQMDK